MSEEHAEHSAALVRLYALAAFDSEEIDQVEAPFLCEDGETFQRRAFTTSGRDFSVTYARAAG